MAKTARSVSDRNEDETSEVCQWLIPEAHPYEHWSDAPAYDGTISIIQPLIAPLYGGKSAHEISRRIHRNAREIELRNAFAITGRRSTRAPISKPGGSIRCTTASSKIRPLPAVNATAKLIPASASFGAAASGLRNFLPQRSLYPRRPLREQRLAAGTAAAGFAPDVGQRGDRQREDGERSERHRRRPRGDRLQRPHGLGLGLARAGSAGWFHRAESGLRPHAFGPRGQWRGLRCLSAAHRRQALTSCSGATGAQAGREVPARRRAAPLHDGRPRAGPCRHARRVQAGSLLLREAERDSAQWPDDFPARSSNTKAMRGAWRST